MSKIRKNAKRYSVMRDRCAELRAKIIAIEQLCNSTELKLKGIGTRNKQDNLANETVRSENQLELCGYKMKAMDIERKLRNNDLALLRTDTSLRKLEIKSSFLLANNSILQQRVDEVTMRKAGMQAFFRHQDKLNHWCEGIQNTIAQNNELANNLRESISLCDFQPVALKFREAQLNYESTMNKLKVWKTKQIMVENKKIASSLWDALLVADMKPVADKFEEVKINFAEVSADIEAIKIGTGRPSKRGPSCLKSRKNQVRKHVNIKTSLNKIRYIH